LEARLTKIRIHEGWWFPSLTAEQQQDLDVGQDPLADGFVASEPEPVRFPRLDTGASPVLHLWGWRNHMAGLRGPMGYDKVAIVDGTPLDLPRKVRVWLKDGAPLPNYQVLERSEARHARLLIKRLAQDAGQITSLAVFSPEEEALLAQYWSRIASIERGVHRCIDGKASGLLVCGKPGMGKTEAVLRVLRARAEEIRGLLPPDAAIDAATIGELEPAYCYMKGGGSPAGFRNVARCFRFRHQIIVPDDCDAVIQDQDSVDLIKALCDSSKDADGRIRERAVNVVMGNGQTFRCAAFAAALVMISNLQHSEMRATQQRHWAAIKQRMRGEVRIEFPEHPGWEWVVVRDAVFRRNMLGNHHGFTMQQVIPLMEFLAKHIDDVDDMSLRTISDCGAIYKDEEDWQTEIRNNKFKG
jgi:hypothetical protein